MPRISEVAKTERQHQIIDGARRCFAAFGYDGATLPRLEKATGLTRGGIFHYFENKQALFVAAARASSERFERLWMTQGYSAAFEALADEDPGWIAVQIEASMRARTDPALARALEAHEEPSGVPKRLEHLRGEVRTDVPIEQIAMFMSALANGLGLRIATGDPIVDPSALNELLRSGVSPREK